MLTYDIYYRGAYPNNVLSNLYPNKFVIDGVVCESMEGFLQALTHHDKHTREYVVRHSGVTAKRLGNPKWKERGLLYWNGEVYDRNEIEYQELLDRVYSLLLTNDTFKNALKYTGDDLLIHSIGNHDPLHTILTEYEFCSRLMMLRSII